MKRSREADKAAQLIAQKQRTMSNLASIQSDVTDVAMKIAEHREEKAKFEELKKQLREKLTSETEKRTRSTHLPFGKESTQDIRFIFVKGGRLFRNTNANGRNANELQVVVEGGSHFIEPVPAKGLVIAPDSTNIEEVKIALSSHPPAQFDLKVFVWADSFAEFQIVQSAVAELGLRHIPIIVPANERVKRGTVREREFSQ